MGELPTGRLRYRGYIPGLDVLRGSAILAVLFDHGISGVGHWSQWHGLVFYFAYLTSYGANGVQLFYILSGFLISGILLDNAQTERYYRTFYIRRALRILPVYLLLLAALKAFHVVSWKFILACLLYIANLAGLVGASNSEYGVLWSLAVEEQFYLVWPVVIRNCSRVVVTRVVIAALILTPLVRLGMTLVHSDPYYKTWDNADYLCYGALIALAVRSGRLHAGNIRLIARALLTSGSCLFALFVYADLAGFTRARAFLPWSGVAKLPLVCIFLAMLLTVLANNRGAEQIAQRSPGARFLAFLGYISYGLYLVHQLIYLEYDRLTAGHALDIRQPGFNLTLVRFLVVSSFAILVAFLSRRFFEQLFLRRKDALAPEPMKTTSAPA